MESSRVGGDADIGRHRQRQSGPHRGAVDAGDNRLVVVEPQCEQEAADPTLLVEDLVLFRQACIWPTAVAATQVETGTESIAVPDDGDDANIIVDAGLADTTHDRPSEGRRECVLPLGPIEAEDSDVADVLGEEIGHQRRLWRVAGRPEWTFVPYSSRRCLTSPL